MMKCSRPIDIVGNIVDRCSHSSHTNSPLIGDNLHVIRHSQDVDLVDMFRCSLDSWQCSHNQLNPGILTIPSTQNNNNHNDETHLQSSTRLHLGQCFGIGRGTIRSLIFDVHQFLERERIEIETDDNDRYSTVVDLASHLSLQGYSSVFLRRNNGRCSYEYGKAVAKHTFITVFDDFDDMAQEVIVDIAFREQFQIARACSTPRFQEALSLTPNVFVGTRANMICGARTLYSEMQRSFLHQNMSFPPWRNLSNILERWQTDDSYTGKTTTNREEQTREKDVHDQIRRMESHFQIFKA